MKLTKMDKKQLIISLILILNIGIISIPYSIKNNNLNNKIKNIKKTDILAVKNKDFYKIYDDFKLILDKLEIVPIETSVSIDEHCLSIDISLNNDIISILELFTYIHQDIDDMYILSSNISKNKTSSIVFCVEN